MLELFFTILLADVAAAIITPYILGIKKGKKKRTTKRKAVVIPFRKAD